MAKRVTYWDCFPPDGISLIYQCPICTGNFEQTLIDLLTNGRLKCDFGCDCEIDLLEVRREVKS